MLLKVEDLQISVQKKNQPILKEISFSLEEGEILGIVGESGSGKTMTALGIMGLLSSDLAITKGSIVFDGKEIARMTLEEQRYLKGSGISMIFQEPMTSLNPVLPVGTQVQEMLTIRKEKSIDLNPFRFRKNLKSKNLEDKEENYKRTLEMLREVGLEDTEKLYYQYPHQLSGGMRQRVMIAMAMILTPRLLIADEPTTALDVTIQAQILELIKRMNQKYGTSVIFISHDLGIVKNMCSRGIVMNDGRIVEQGKIHDLFYHPREAYTKKIVAAAPKREKRKQEKKIENFSENLDMLKVTDLAVFYMEKKSFFHGRGKKQVVKNISFQLKKGEIFGIVGESGSGKSTLAKAIAGMIPTTEGKIERKGNRPQMVFQDPYGSLNPAKKIKWILEEPLAIQGGYSKKERKARVLERLVQVGLKEKHLERYLSQLSGGQRQRVSIAAAMILNPQIVILDEPVSALDVTVQAQILELLLQLREQYDLSYLFISHDLNVIYQMCDRVGVMYHGEFVEMGNVDQIYHNPKHFYTKKLLESGTFKPKPRS